MRSTRRVSQAISPRSTHTPTIRYGRNPAGTSDLRNMDCCSVYTLREGKIVKMNVLPFDAAASDEFWS
jgi:hypothetical protein